MKFSGSVKRFGDKVEIRARGKRRRRNPRASLVE